MKREEKSKQCSGQVTDKGGEIVLYKAKDGRTRLDVRLDQDTVWLDAHQMATLFGRDRTVIVRHIRNIYTTKELAPTETCAKIAQVAADGKIRQMDTYNLDMIISVGYRVNSKQGTQFRIWATQVLREHILQGYTINERRLREENTRLIELRNAVDVMGRILAEKPVSGDEAQGLLKVITDYSLALRLLDQYDHQQLRLQGTTGTARFELSYEAAIEAIAHMQSTMGELTGGLFGREKDKGLAAAIGAVHQTFGGRDVYPSVEEKAAHLLYFVVKNHAFV
jgi:hypothetical protein